MATHEPTANLKPPTTYFEEGYNQANGIEPSSTVPGLADSFDNPEYVDSDGVGCKVEDRDYGVPKGFGDSDPDPEAAFHDMLRGNGRKPGWSRALAAESRISVGPLQLDADDYSTQNTYDQVYSTNSFGTPKVLD